jgi:hypothetical protein
MWMWAVPAAILMLTAVPALVLMARLSEEARRFSGEVRGFGDLRPAMVELRTDVRTARAAARNLRQ